MSETTFESRAEKLGMTNDVQFAGELFYGFTKQAIDANGRTIMPTVWIGEAGGSEPVSSLSHPASICLRFYPYQMLSSVALHFNSAADALNALHSPDFVVAMVWEGLESIAPDDVEDVIDAYTQLSDAADQWRDQEDVSMAEIAEILFRRYGAYGKDVNEIVPAD